MKLKSYLMESEEKYKEKAGVIIFHEGEILLVKPSDPNYGGPDFQIPKGRVKTGNSIEDTAIREEMEETGLKRSNIQSIKKIKAYNIAGMFGSYNLTLSAIKVEDKNNFNESDYEIEEKRWFKFNEAMNIIRSNQKKILKDALGRL
jgi:8-oxo-dGTP pyrophosphatase MutT (NUDIX family)